MEEFDYASVLPTEPPEGLIKWLYEKGIFDNEYIVYRADYDYEPLENKRVKVVRCKCTACGHEFIQPYAVAGCCTNSYAPATFGFWNEVTGEGVISGMDTICPYCGTGAEVLHCSNISRYGRTLQTVIPMSIHKVNNCIALLSWNIQRTIDSQGNIKIISWMHEGYVFEKRKTIRLTGYQKFFSSISYSQKWNQKSRCDDNLGSISRDYIFPWDKSMLEGTPTENCKLDKYIKSAKNIYPVSYMKLWKKHNNIENLVMQGAGKLLNEKIDSVKYSYYAPTPRMNNIKGINYKEKKPHKMLGLNKEEFRFMIKNKWDAYTLDFYLNAKEYGVKKEDVKMCHDAGFHTVNVLLEIDSNAMKTLRYLEKQRKKFKLNKNLINAQYIIDYWDMAKKNGDDLTKDEFRYPHNLQRAHDMAVRLLKIKESEELKPLFEERVKQLEKYCFNLNGLSIHAARDEKEMIDEGKILNHCVGRYAKRHAEGKTTIFFIRHEDDPEQPYFTLEFDFNSMSVIQNRGFKNCERTKEVREFENKWVKFVKEVAKAERSAA